jgi:hypothetical protein
VKWQRKKSHRKPRAPLRHYILDKGVVRDDETGVVRAAKETLNGDLEPFIRARLLGC